MEAQHDDDEEFPTFGSEVFKRKRAQSSPGRKRGSTSGSKPRSRASTSSSAVRPEKREIRKSPKAFVDPTRGRRGGGGTPDDRSLDSLVRERRKGDEWSTEFAPFNFGAVHSTTSSRPAGAGPNRRGAGLRDTLKVCSAPQVEEQFPGPSVHDVSTARAVGGPPPMSGGFGQDSTRKRLDFESTSPRREPFGDEHGLRRPSTTPAGPASQLGTRRSSRQSFYFPDQSWTSHSDKNGVDGPVAAAEQPPIGNISKNVFVSKKKPPFTNTSAPTAPNTSSSGSSSSGSSSGDENIPAFPVSAAVPARTLVARRPSTTPDGERPRKILGGGTTGGGNKKPSPIHEETEEDLSSVSPVKRTTSSVPGAGGRVGTVGRFYSFSVLGRYFLIVHVARRSSFTMQSLSSYPRRKVVVSEEMSVSSARPPL